MYIEIEDPNSNEYFNGNYITRTNKTFDWTIESRKFSKH